MCLCVITTELFQAGKTPKADSIPGAQTGFCHRHENSVFSWPYWDLNTAYLGESATFCPFHNTGCPMALEGWPFCRSDIEITHNAKRDLCQKVLSAEPPREGFANLIDTVQSPLLSKQISRFASAGNAKICLKIFLRGETQRSFNVLHNSKHKSALHIKKRQLLLFQEYESFKWLMARALWRAENCLCHEML